MGLKKFCCAFAEAPGTYAASNVSANGDVAYSYGRHYPLAVLDRKNKTALVNKDKFSVSTSRHQSSMNLALARAGYVLEGVDTETIKAAAEKSEAASGGKRAPAGKRYHRIDGWRGYYVPELAVVGASDTGMYEDSPCKSDDAESEIRLFKDILSKNGIRSTVSYGTSSNVFCTKHWLKVGRKDFDKAAKIVLDVFNEHGRGLKLAHTACLDQLGYETRY